MPHPLPLPLFLGLLSCLLLTPWGCGTSGEGDDDSSSLGPDEILFETESYTVQPGEEKYLCTTMRMDEATYIDRFIYSAPEGVHHLVMVQTLYPEPEGASECNVLFKDTWLPIFSAGYGDADLRTPEGSGFEIPYNAQLLIQLHLLNTTGQALEGKAGLVMHTLDAEDAIPAGIYGFGTQFVTLPPNQETTLTSDCTVPDDVEVFAAFPHMHTLGTSIRFLTGPDEASLEERYRLDDWSFGDQPIDLLPLHIEAGEMTRVECVYNNVTDTEVTFGESTSDEMCYFTTFVTPYHGLDGCVNLLGD